MIATRAGNAWTEIRKRYLKKKNGRTRLRVGLKREMRLAWQSRRMREKADIDNERCKEKESKFK
jgi:hypothetical protein